MKRIVLALFGIFATATAVEAQNNQQLIERALMAAPSRARDAAAVVRWNPDHTWTTIKEGEGSMVCYDHSGAAGEAPFAVQCTHPGNLERVAQNFRFEAEARGDRQAVQQRVAQAEANGTRVQPVYGSVWISLNGQDAASANRHITIAVPGATAASTNLPDRASQGSAWLMNAGTTSAHIMVPGT